MQQFSKPSDFLYPNCNFSVIDGKVVISHSDDELKKIVLDEMIACRKDKVWQLANKMFVDDKYQAFCLRPAQLAIFKCIFQRLYPRVEIVSSTQYGKTLNLSKALLARITTFPEDWLITVPDTKRGQLLLNYMLKATAENDYFRAKLKGTHKRRDALNRLLEEKSKVKLTYQVHTEDGVPRYGSVEIISCEAYRKNNAINAIMGFSGRNVISDESSLVSDEIEAGIFRMLAGKGEDTCYIKIGNPFYRNHFYDSFINTKYKKIYINDRIGLADGAYTQSFLDEALSKPKADILYHSNFPGEGDLDSGGYTNLITQTELEQSFVTDLNLFGRLRMGVDVAGGGKNWSVIVLRGDNGAKIIWRSKTKDSMRVADKAYFFATHFKLEPEQIFVDKVGIGRGCYDRLVRLMGDKVNGVAAGEVPEVDGTESMYANLRAQMGWRLRTWLLSGMRLVKHQSFYEILVMKYKIKSDKKIQMIPKEELRKKHILSPDCYDALALTFAVFQEVIFESKAEIAFKQMLKKKKEKRNKNRKSTLSGLKY